jgi:hypothetical protein
LAFIAGASGHGRYLASQSVRYTQERIWLGPQQYGRGPGSEAALRFMQSISALARDRLNRRADMIIDGHLGHWTGVEFHEEPSAAGAEPVQEVREAPVRLQRDVLAQPASAPAPDEFGGFFRSPQRGAPEVFEGPVFNGSWAGQRLSSMSPTIHIVAVPTVELGIHTYTYGWNSVARGWFLI